MIATRETLLDAAESLFLEQGVSNTTLEQIARRAGMTRGAIYWHFRNKAALFDAMLERVSLPLDQLLDDLEDRDQANQPLEGVRQAFHLALARLAMPRYQRVYTILLHRCEFVGDFNPIERQNRLAQESFEHLLKRCTQAAKAGVLDARMTDRCAARLMHTTMVGLIYEWLRDPTQYRIREDGGGVVDALFTVLEKSNNHDR